MASRSTRVEDEEIGQIPRAYVVRVASSKLSENQVIEFVAGHIPGLRYLHEECRVGCIIHRDIRFSNILITHNFEPVPNGDTGVETRVIGTFGYLVPEYAQSGKITEKVYVNSFEVVLLELVTRTKVLDLTRPMGQQCLTEWARPLLEEYTIEELIDPRLGNHYSKHEVYCMLHAASLCIQCHPQCRSCMSQLVPRHLHSFQLQSQKMSLIWNCLIFLEVEV
ncbi:hypothetical protein JHK85_004526 [Glycine max]|nr:hypothetical protein JHK85_004526 [Glycine max]KAG5080283.1 hypothetical protein JHK86_004348 [Glycine max]